MNYVSYLKKQGFKPSPKFHLSEKTRWSFNDGVGLIYDDVYQKEINGDNELCEKRFYSNSISLIKHNILESKLIKSRDDIFRLGSVSCTKKDSKWNQFLYKSGDDHIHIYLLKGVYVIILTDSKFTYISSKKFNVNEMKSGNFDNTLMSVIGKVKYRDYIINRI